MWIVYQIGASEHYSIPRALLNYDQLGALLTDVWIPPVLSSAPARPQKLRDRYHPDISPEMVWAPNCITVV